MLTRLARVTAMLGLSAAAFTACAVERSPSAPIGLTPPSRASHDASSLWANVVDGQTGPGSSYRLYLPRTWNGKLVVYAHGIVAPFAPVALPAEGDGMAALFGSQGFGVALSSFSETGFAVKDGRQRTHQLRGLFAARFGKPARTYLAGSSMGGLIIAALAEQYPKLYDGALAMCGVVGGMPAEFEYVFNARALFDALYPGVLPGSVKAVPMPSDPGAALLAIADIQNRAALAIGTDARPVPGAVQIALVDQTAMPLPTALGGPLTNEQFGAFVITPLLLHAIFVNDIVAHTQGHYPFSNAETRYTSSAPFMAPFLTALNAAVPRVSADRDAYNWLAHNAETSGALAIPMLTLHTRFDTWVPIVTEAVYRQRVAANGASDLLVQRTTNGFDHCNFAPSEIARGLAELAAWVEHGVKPIP